MNIKKVAIAIIAIVAIAGTTAFFIIKSSPKYSLYKAKTAYQNHDLAEFRKYVDIEGVVESLIDGAMDSGITNGQPKNEASALGEQIGKGLLTLIKPKFVEVGTNEIEKLVESGQPPNTESKKGFSVEKLLKSNNADKSGYKGVSYVKKEGKLAFVGLDIFNKKYDEILTLELKMRDMGGYWQIASINNFSEYTNKIEELKTAWIAEQNTPIIKEMSKSIKLIGMQKDTQVKDKWGFDSSSVVYISSENISNKDINSYVVNANCTNANGEEILNSNLTGSTIKTGEKVNHAWEFDTNRFIKQQKLLFETPASEFNCDLEYQQIVFADGESLELLPK